MATRDSAGIRIVQNGAVGAWPAGEGWRAVEAVSIGEVDGPPEYTFNRIGAVRATPDGRVWVLDGGDQKVRVYDAASGHHLFSFGGKGGGPGEFRGAISLTVQHDTAMVYDYRQRKLAYFDGHGQLLRTEQFDFPYFQVGFPGGLTPVPGGFVTSVQTGCSMPPPEERRPTWKLVTTKATGLVRDTLYSAFNRGTVAVYGDRFCTSFPALARPVPHVAVASDGLVAFGTGATYEIRIFHVTVHPEAPGSAAGPSHPERIIRRTVDPLPVTNEQTAAYKRQFTTADPRDPLAKDRIAQIRAAWDTLGFADVWPPINGLHWDDGGNLWVLRGGPTDDAAQQWDVFDPKGVFQGTVALPGRLRVQTIAGRVVWGTFSDELGVQYVKGYQLSR